MCASKKKAKFSWNRQEIILQRGMFRRILDSKSTFYNGNESDNNDESYNENHDQQQLHTWAAPVHTLRAQTLQGLILFCRNFMRWLMRKLSPKQCAEFS